jgi:hypothetical protein
MPKTHLLSDGLPIAAPTGIPRAHTYLKLPLSVRGLRATFNPTPAYSVRSFAVRSGVFIPKWDAYRFTNEGFVFTNSQMSQIRARYEPFVDILVGAAVTPFIDAMTGLSVSIPFLGALGLPGIVVDAVVGAVVDYMAGSLIDAIAGQYPGPDPRCGGMAFSAYDFYLMDWPVDERLGIAPPSDGPLGDFIFSRLLDSLDANAARFIEWTIQLTMLPIASTVGNVALGAAVGALGGPIGAAFGALLGAEVSLFKFGGPKVILDRSTDEWVKLRQILDRQPAWPLGLVYGDTFNPMDNHQVLAIGYYLASPGSNTNTILLWDDNYGPMLTEFQVDFTGDELRVNADEQDVKGFFVEDYTPTSPPENLRLPYSSQLDRTPDDPA